MIKEIFSIGSLALLLSFNAFSKENKPAQKPNVLFIAIDDLNDWVGCLGGHPQAHTPNIDRLATKGILFTNAHTSAPGCSPSRNSLLTGKEPTNTGYYPFYDHWDKEYLPGYVTLPQYFRQNGYTTYASGKIHHSMAGQNPNYGQRDWTENNLEVLKKLPKLEVDKNDRVGFDEKTEKWISAPTINPLADHDDYQTALYGIKILQQKHDEPFFLAVGFIKPHLPFIAPRKYFDLFDKDNLQLPPIKDDDLNDIPWAGRSNAKIQHDAAIRELGIRKGMIRGYLAASAFTDDMIGMVIDALEKSQYRDNTVIVLWSDHGFHHGEKRSFTKFSLWEESTRVPFIIIDPRMKTLAGEKCNSPVSLINIYPTLIEMCGLPEREGLDGRSLIPLLKKPETIWEQPALTTWGRGNYALRSENWRYIRYFDGSEELYNHQDDPNEWTNLANNTKYKSVKYELTKWFPKTEAKLQPEGTLDPVNADKPDLEGFKKLWGKLEMDSVKK
jgi:arylsulfatase A-like enzyme